MLDDYKIVQPIAYKIMMNAILNNRLTHAYLFETKGYPKALDMALSFCKFIICNHHSQTTGNNQVCNICNKIDSNNYDEIKIISPDGLWIKKEQLDELQIQFSKKAIYGDKKIYIINGAEHLNYSSAASILKFLEEPEDNIIAILITDNAYNVLETIVSRCQIIPFSKIGSKELEKYNEYSKMLVNIGVNFTNNENELLDFLQNKEEKIRRSVNFINYYEVNKKATLLNLNKLFNEVFVEKTDILLAFDIFILYYKDIVNYMCKRKIDLFSEYEIDIEKISKENSIEIIVDKIRVITDMKQNISFNVNSNLLLDKLILLLEGSNING